MIKNDYEFEVLVNCNPVREYYHPDNIAADHKVFIEGKKGTSYSLKVRNNGSRRILIVPSVDGLNVLNGKVADFNGRGYIVDGHSAMTIDGWRTSDKEVAQFFFSDPEKSYAESKGKGNNVGVIGCAVFREVDNQLLKDIEGIFKKLDDIDKKTLPNYPYPYWWWQSTGNTFTLGNNLGNNIDSYTASNYTGNQVQDSSITNTSSNAQRASFKSQDLGTGWGDKKKSEVVTVSFEKEPTPAAIFAIYYNTRQQLEALGINLNSRPQYVAPNPFPNQTDYCEPPTS